MTAPLCAGRWEEPYGQLTHEETVTEYPVRRVQDGERRSAGGVVLGEIRADHTTAARLALHREGDDHNGGIERPHRFDTQQLEGQSALHRLAQRNHAGMRRAAQFTGLRGQSFALTRELLRLPPGQAHPRPAPPIGEPVERELRKAKPLGERG